MFAIILQIDFSVGSNCCTKITEIPIAWISMNAPPAFTDVRPMLNVSTTKEVITVNATMDSLGMVDFATVGSLFQMFSHLFILSVN